MQIVIRRNREQSMLPIEMAVQKQHQVINKCLFILKSINQMSNGIKESDVRR